MKRKALSAKELRVNLSQVIQEIQQGTHFLLIYHSQPVGELRPLPTAEEIAETGDDPLSLLVNPPKGLSFSSRKSAVQLVREERGKA